MSVASFRAAAARFGVAAARVIRWHGQRRNTGTYASKPQDGDTRSRRIEAHRETMLTVHEARRDITLDEQRRELSQAGVTVAIATLHRFFARHGITRKKMTGHTVEQDRADDIARRDGLTASAPILAANPGLANSTVPWGFACIGTAVLV
ncbi:hypothetical protein [Sphingomonas sp. Leaf10]|uniref:hypothetical protein n=1 Tax=Sphingomonas sp. Leaf10 TaxID=1735676 RepID=UPI000A839028|nr:hypothetical protein [Sphingomonas sp. Leaf10]